MCLREVILIFLSQNKFLLADDISNGIVSTKLFQTQINIMENFPFCFVNASRHFKQNVFIVFVTR